MTDLSPRLTIPFHQPSFNEEEIQTVVETLKSGWITTGPAVKAFETAFAEYIGVKHAIAVNSCTAAMHLALAALGIKPGDEVITTPYTFVATAEAIQYAGATPVFVDILERDFNIDPQGVAAFLRTKRGGSGNVRAILPVHIAGHPCDMGALLKIADENQLFVVEDAAHCLEGSVRLFDQEMYDSGKLAEKSDVGRRGDNHVRAKSGNGRMEVPVGSGRAGWRKVGTIGEATCFSFYATKNITTGEGGMVTTNRDDLAEQVRVLSLHGMSRDAWKRYHAEGSWYYEIVTQGYKYNMPDILAALGKVQLHKVERMFATRRKYARLLMEELQDLQEVILPGESTQFVHAWHLFIIRLRLENLQISRNEFITRLKERGVHCSVHFIPLHLHPFYREKFNHRRGDFPVAERVYESVVSLPFYPAMSEEEVRYLAAAVRATIEQHAFANQIFVPEKIG